ncbi:hypothetical protein CLOP_g12478 [Closterium sp. NIES-67]|nr:hypothetical protein CLOP_g12478 [Closterium sp. NIES-67]
MPCDCPARALLTTARPAFHELVVPRAEGKAPTLHDCTRGKQELLQQGWAGGRRKKGARFSSGISSSGGSCSNVGASLAGAVAMGTRSTGSGVTIP